MSQSPLPPIKAVFFDFMGTCLDWHTTIVAALPAALPDDLKSQFALLWRQAYFDASAARLAAGQPYEDIDLTHTTTLNALLTSPPPTLPLAPDHIALFTSAVRARCITAWHRQRAWPDALHAIRHLRTELGRLSNRAAEERLDVIVHANGTTRLQLDLARSSGLEFDLLLSSELLGEVYKPGADSYRRALELLRCEPREAVMVACHAYDTRGAMQVGMRGVYVRRWTDDVREDQDVVRGEHEVYLEDGMDRLVKSIEAMM